MKHNSSQKTHLIGPETEIQQYGTVVNRPLSLDHKVRLSGADKLIQILADTMTLRDMYKKHHWQVSADVLSTPPSVRQALRRTG
jgi:DNA-directed RNA polymerase sigma subunit (sigma70/sigma32)